MVEGRPRWQARWRDDLRRQRKRTFARKIDAERFLAAIEADKLRGMYVDPSDRTTFGEYAETWTAVQVHRPTTRAQVETHLRRHVLPFFADRPMSAVRPGEVQAWVRGRSAELAPSTVRVIYRYVAAIFRAAVTDRLIAVSPCVGVRLPKVEPTRVAPISTETVLALADAVPARYRALVVLAVGTGLRQGEAFGLTVDRVDFLRRELTVDRQLVTMPDRAPYLAPPKTQASVRAVPLPQVVVDALAAHLAAWPTDELVFTTELGDPIRRTAFSAAVWRPAVRRAGLSGVTMHALRHFYASLLIRHGESVKTVQARLTPASAAEPLATYSHLWPDSDDRTRAAIDAVLRRAAHRVADSARTDAHL